MFNFDQPRFEKVTGGAIGLRGDIEACVDKICADGYANLFLIGIGGTWAHYLPLKYMADTCSAADVYVENAGEFVLMDHHHFNKDSVAVFCSRTGNTKEIVAAAEHCKDKGARVISFIAHEDTPLAKLSDFVFLNYAEDDHLGESIYLQATPCVLRFLHNRGDFARYDEFAAGLDGLTPYLVKAKEQYEDTAKAWAEAHKDMDYVMVAGSGMLWGEAYDFAMCILEEMQWIRTKSIHAAEFFHGTLELLEADTPIIMLCGDDETRPLTDRMQRFASTITKDIITFDTSTVDLPLPAGLRKYVSPLVVYCVLERLACHLEHVRNHPLTTRRYYRQMDY